MVRTRADNTARKSVAAKAPRKNFNAGSSSTSSPTTGKSNRHSGGNPYCPRPTPDWQKEITRFFAKVPREKKSDKENLDPEDAGAGSSKMDEGASSSKTSDKSKVKKSKLEASEKTAEEQEKAMHGEEGEMMQVEIEIVDKKRTPEKQSKESPKRFKKNNCISDSEDDD